MNTTIASTEVRVEFVGTVDEIPDALWHECFPPPIEGRFWYETLETCGLEGQFTFCYGKIFRGDEAVGVAPCFLHDVPISLVAPPLVAAVLRGLGRVFPRVSYQRTFFIGSPCADEGTIGLTGGVRLAEVADALRAAVRRKARELGARMIVFKDFPRHDVPALTARSGAGEFVATVSYPGTVVALPAGGREAYLRALSHNQRHNLLKKLRRSAAALPLTTTVVVEPSDAELAEIDGLFQQTYEKGRTKFERLDRRFFERVRRQAPARFILMRDGAGALAAFMLVFCLGSRVVNKFIGLDYRRGAQAFLYFRLFDAAVELAYANGGAELQSGQTGYRAKLDLGHRLVPLCNVFHHEQPLVHALFRTIGRRVTWQSLDDDLRNYLRAHPESGGDPSPQ